MRIGVRIAFSMALALALAGGVTAAHEGNAMGQAGARRPAWLGVELDPTRGEGRGVRVRHAIRSSPGWNAGIRDGDIVLRVGDASTLRPDDVIREISAQSPRAVVRIVLLRSACDI